LHRQLAEAFKQALPMLSEAGEQFDELLSGKIPLGVLTDIIAFTLPAELLSEKERLLAECDVDERARRLLAGLEAGLKLAADAEQRGRLKYPPDFSPN
jgi:ATP-dependent Lon protease